MEQGGDSNVRMEPSRWGGCPFSVGFKKGWDVDYSGPTILGLIISSASARHWICRPTSSCEIACPKKRSIARDQRVRTSRQWMCCRKLLKKRQCEIRATVLCLLPAQRASHVDRADPHVARQERVRRLHDATRCHGYEFPCALSPPTNCVFSFCV